MNNSINRVTVLQTAGSSYSVKFMEFTRIHSQYPHVVVCFFEGEDEKYYSLRLTMYLGNNKWKGVFTGGKKQVFDVVEAIQSNNTYKDSHYAGFVDKDFQEWEPNINPERIYITPCYSIENFYASESCLARVLSAEFKVSEFGDETQDYKKCINTFRERFNEFIMHVLYFMCWAKAHRIMERDNKSLPALNIRNVKTEDLVSVSIDRVDINYDVTNIKSAVRDFTGPDLCPIAFAEAQSSFDGRNCIPLFRGKQIIDFFRLFLLKLKEDITSNTPQFFSAKKSVKLSLSKDNIISELSQYADTPECLIKFLEKLRDIQHCQVNLDNSL